MVFGDFNLEPTNTVMMNFMDSQNFINLIKNNTCFKGVGSCIDLILTNRKYSHESFKDDLMSKTVDKNVDFLKFEKEFIDTLNKNVPKKTKLFRGNQKLHVNKVLRSAIMKRLPLKSKANKTRKVVDLFDYKKQT